MRATVLDEIEVVFQINGKVRDKLVVPATATAQEMESVALSQEKIKAWIDGKQIVRIICVPKKLVNIVIK